MAALSLLPHSANLSLFQRYFPFGILTTFLNFIDWDAEFLPEVSVDECNRTLRLTPVGSNIVQSSAPHENRFRIVPKLLNR